MPVGGGLGAGLPTGTVTMLFSDIEGSTALVSRLKDRYGEALTTQRQIMRAAIEASSGHEMGTEGDSFFVVFDSARRAMGACLQAQRALGVTTWPGGDAVRVRMGLHSGEPTRHEDGYIGVDLNRAARIAATAHGGQVLVSATTRQLIGAQLPADVELTDVGWHRLKDIDELEHLFSVSAPGLAEGLGPPRSLGTQSRLPSPPTPLVGRRKEVEALQSTLRRPGVRLVTLTGPGGVGKTRVAVALASSLDATFTDGVYFVSLAAVTSVDAMWIGVADTIGVGAEGDPSTAVVRWLAGRSVLLVLDNLEQVAAAADVVAALLEAAPRLVVVATSRRPLHLRAEQDHPVPPLGGPAGPALAEVAESGAVRLFVQQAALVRRGFDLTEANAADVAAICRRLDGLPLAIELAAARAKLLTPKALLTRLGDSLDLAATDVDRPSRQQTLRATIAWSHDLLTADVERVFRRMAMFAGGCDLDAIEAVIVDPTAPGEAGDALQAVTDLLDLSLVTVTETPEGDVRVAMLETIREYAHSQLRHAGELDTVQQRHAVYYADFAEQAGAEMQGPHQLVWLDRLEIEHENLRAALSWALAAEPAVETSGPGRSDHGADEQRGALGLRLANALSWFWYGRSHLSDGRRWLELAIENASGDTGAALAAARHGLGILLLQEGEHEQARALLERNLEAWRSLSDDDGLAKELNSLGVTYRNLGRPDIARQRLEESLEIARRIGADARVSTALSNLATVETDTGSPERAVALLRESIDIGRRLGNAWAVVVDHGNLAAALLVAGRAAEAQQLLGSLLGDVVSIGDAELTADTLERLAASAADLGADTRAARLVGHAQQIREAAGVPMVGLDRALLERAIGPARARTPAGEWEHELALGQQSSLAATVALCVQAT